MKDAIDDIDSFSLDRSFSGKQVRNRLELHSFKLRFEYLVLAEDTISIPLIALVYLSINGENCEILYGI